MSISRAPVVCLALLSGLLAAPAFAGARVCSYGGKEFDDRDDPPKDFSGEYSCKDAGTGKVVLREHHARGHKEGDYTKYDHLTGRIEESGRYHNDQLDGLVRSYRDGVVYQEATWVRGKRLGVQKEMEGGKLVRLYVIDDDGRGGTSVQFNKKGQATVIQCGSRPIGKQDAAWCGFEGKQSSVTLYDEQGRKAATGQYLAGKRHGLWKRLDPDTGKVTLEERYENGKLLGDGQKEFDPNGTLLVKTTCNASKTTCIETQFFDGGKETKAVVVRDGAKITKATDYYQNGKPQREVVREGGRVRVTEYYDNGKPELRGTYVDSMSDWLEYIADGVEETYDRKGALESRQNYDKGRRQGPGMRFVTRDGKRYRYEWVYDKDVLVKEKVFVGDGGSPIEESEYFPDGSTKSHKDYGPAPAASD